MFKKILDFLKDAQKNPAQLIGLLLLIFGVFCCFTNPVYQLHKDLIIYNHNTKLWDGPPSILNKFFLYRKYELYIITSLFIFGILLIIFQKIVRGKIANITRNIVLYFRQFLFRHKFKICILRKLLQEQVAYKIVKRDKRYNFQGFAICYESLHKNFVFLVPISYKKTITLTKYKCGLSQEDSIKNNFFIFSLSTDVKVIEPDCSASSSKKNMLQKYTFESIKDINTEINKVFQEFITGQHYTEK